MALRHTGKTIARKFVGVTKKWFDLRPNPWNGTRAEHWVAKNLRLDKACI